MSKTDKIFELKKLLDSGLINKTDFDKLKKQIFEETLNEATNSIELSSSEIKNNVYEQKNDLLDKRKCPQCGSENQVDSNDCVVCKTDLTNYRKTVNPYLEPDVETNRSKYFIPIVLFGLLIIFGSFYIFRNYQSSNNEKSKESIEETLSNDTKIVTQETTPSNDGRESNVDSTYINNESIASFLGNWTDGLNTDISISNDKSLSIGNSVCSSKFTYKESGSELILVFEYVECKFQTQGGNNNGQEVGKCYIQNGKLIVDLQEISELEGTSIGGGNYEKGSRYD